jgi:hypothetical protein
MSGRACWCTGRDRADWGEDAGRELGGKARIERRVALAAQGRSAPGPRRVPPRDRKRVQALRAATVRIGRGADERLHGALRNADVERLRFCRSVLLIGL